MDILTLRLLRDSLLPDLLSSDLASASFYHSSHHQIMTDINGLASAVTLLIEGIKAALDHHAEQKRRRRLQEQQQHNFFEEFARASGPPDDNHGALTVREYCRRLSEIIQTHRHYLWRNASNSSRSLRGGYDARAAHGFMAAGIMTAALMPGIPQASEEPSIADNSVPAAMARKSLICTS